MKVIICKDYEQMSRKAADIFSERIRAKPDIVLGLATGGTPERLYAILAEKNSAGEVDFSRVRTFSLDEYVGLPPEHDQSYRYFMNTKLFDRINIDKANTRIPDGVAVDLDEECRNYEEEIRAAGGIDLQLLGIGSNGHVAFNEPGSSTDSRTRVVELDESTIRDNARFFRSADEVPRRALSMGMASIMEAKEVLLIAYKESKADAVAAAVEGPVTVDCPASLLQEHPNATIIVDEAAAGKLMNRASCEILMPAEAAVPAEEPPEVAVPAEGPPKKAAPKRARAVSRAKKRAKAEKKKPKKKPKKAKAKKKKAKKKPKGKKKAKGKK